MPRRATRNVVFETTPDIVARGHCVGHGLQVDTNQLVAVMGRQLIELRPHAVEELALDAGLGLRRPHGAEQPGGHVIDEVMSRVAASDQRGTGLRQVVVAQKLCERALLQLQEQHVGQRPDQAVHWLAAG